MNEGTDTWVGVLAVDKGLRRGTAESKMLHPQSDDDRHEGERGLETKSLLLGIAEAHASQKKVSRSRMAL